MLEKVVVEFTLEWIKTDGDTTPCIACEEPIYGKMNTLVFVVGEKKSETKVKVCESCFEVPPLF